MGDAFVRDKGQLKQLQSLPLDAKVVLTQQRIREWYEHFGGDVFVSFSGGKDSTVLAHLVHGMYPEVPLVFDNTGLEFPEIQAFARDMGAEVIRPKISFSEVISTYGYPIISKENSEAIQYARRIRNSSSDATHTHTHTHTHTQARAYGTEETDGTVRKRNYGYKRSQFMCGGCNQQQEKTDWHDWRRKALTGVGPFDPVERSLYTKKKWLPLCRDTQFKISHMCCTVMKKKPLTKYQKDTKRAPFIGMLADESKLRVQLWIRNGCNAFDARHKTSNPMSFWTEQDVLQYIVDNNLPIASVYGDICKMDKKTGLLYDAVPGCQCNDLVCTGCQRTGCVFCGFGAHLEKGVTRFQRLAYTHPKQYEYCMGGGQWVDNPDYDPFAPEYDGEWKNWNPKKIWVPSKEGLGMKKVFDDCNEIYGKDFIRYE